MNIQRISRQMLKDEWPACDYCDQPIQVGYCFSGEGVGGPRSGAFLHVCDGCLARARSSPIKFWSDPKEEKTDGEEKRE
jgi:hypothetical protein